MRSRNARRSAAALTGNAELGRWRTIARALAALAACLAAGLSSTPGARRRRSGMSATALPLCSAATVRQRIVAVQPERGEITARDADYHDLSRTPAPCLCCVLSLAPTRKAFMPSIHMGAHGTLEWLPGKSVALSDDMLARGADRRHAGHLSLHRQRSRRGGAGQAAHRCGDDRASATAACARRLARAARSARAPARRIFDGRRPRPSAPRSG